MEDFLIYFIYVLIITFFSKKIFIKLNLTDKPSIGKIHKESVPFSGGLILILCFFYILNKDIIVELEYIFVNVILIFLIGFVDDKFNLKPDQKFLALFFSCLFTHNDFLINYLGFFPIIGDVYLYKLSLILNILFVVLFCNAFNYIDGIDGVALFNFFTSIVFILIQAKPNTDILVFSMYLIIPILILIIINFNFLNLGKIFLGDGGSLSLGYIISNIIIFYSYKNSLSPIIFFWPIAYVIFDFLIVNYYRIQNNVKIFTRSNDHFHHIVRKKVKSDFLSFLIISSIHISILVIGYFCNKFFTNLYVILIMIIITFMIFLLLRKRFMINS